VFTGYLNFNGVEIINSARTAAYIKALLPKVEVYCDDAPLGPAIGHSSYISPARDKAPWYQGARAITGQFYGLLPGKVQGAEDSTRGIEVTELTGDGAVLTGPRHTSREIRYTATMFAANEEAMEEGLAWLRDVLTSDGCSEAEQGCLGHTTRMFKARPATKVQAYNFTREFYLTEVSEGPLVKKKLNSRAGAIWEIEFTITAGRPWAFTALQEVGTLNMDTAVNFQDPAGENCGAILDPYESYIDDPYFSGISKPPKPPVITPPNLLSISSWRRKTLTIPSATTSRFGRVVPRIRIVTGDADAQFLRLRFYRDEAGLSGCDFDGEFLISYIPANTVMTLDAIRRSALVAQPGGRQVPAGHLLFGSGGRPFLWPTLGCQHAYTMTADLMPGQPGVVVLLDTAVRE
jgi:hypothetical protein